MIIRPEILAIIRHARDIVELADILAAEPPPDRTPEDEANFELLEQIKESNIS